MDFYSVVKSNNLRRSNRYRKCKILKDLETGESLLGSREIKEIPNSRSDIIHTVAPNETTRLDLLAHRYYNNALLWWVIAEANNITNPITEIPTGTFLRIPSIDTLYSSGGVLS